MKYLTADAITGIWEVESLEIDNVEVMTQEEFADELSTLAVGRLIACQADSDHVARILRDYSIKFL